MDAFEATVSGRVLDHVVLPSVRFIPLDLNSRAWVRFTHQVAGDLVAEVANVSRGRLEATDGPPVGKEDAVEPLVDEEDVVEPPGFLP